MPSLLPLPPVLEDETRPVSLPSEGQGGQMDVVPQRGQSLASERASVVVMKQRLRYQILLSIQAESNVSVKRLLTAHCDPAQDTQQTQGQLVQQS